VHADRRTAGATAATAASAASASTAAAAGHSDVRGWIGDSGDGDLPGSSASATTGAGARARLLT